MIVNVVVIIMIFEFLELNLNVRGNIMEKVFVLLMVIYSEMNIIFKFCVIRLILGIFVSILINVYKRKIV